MVYGSLHFVTFDGTEYSFKALGEFVILRLSSSTGSNIFTLQGQTDKLYTDAKGIIEVPVVVRMAAFHQGIGKVRMFVCVEGRLSLLLLTRPFKKFEYQFQSVTVSTGCGGKEESFSIKIFERKFSHRLIWPQIIVPHF